MHDYSTDAGDTQYPSLINLGASPGPGFRGGTQVAPRPVSAERGRSDFDVRHSFVISHVVELPIGRGRRWLSGAGGLMEGLVGGYALAGICRVQSGIPANVVVGRDYNSVGDSQQNRPALLGGSLADIYAN